VVRAVDGLLGGVRLHEGGHPGGLGLAHHRDIVVDVEPPQSPGKWSARPLPPGNIEAIPWPFTKRSEQLRSSPLGQLASGFTLCRGWVLDRPGAPEVWVMCSSLAPHAMTGMVTDGYRS